MQCFNGGKKIFKQSWTTNSNIFLGSLSLKKKKKEKDNLLGYFLC